jgi:glycosyltransferase involved in cell wall biosynthesis
VKILIITPSYKPAFVYGGPIFSVAYLAENLLKHNEVFVLSTNANGKENLTIDTLHPLQMDGVNIRFFKRQTKDHSHLSIGMLRYLWKHGGEYQVIHIQSWWNTVAVLTALICKIKSWKYIISPRGMLSPYTIEHSIVKKIIHNLIGNYLLKNAIIHVTSNDEKQKLDKLNPRYTLIDVPNYVDVNSKSQNVIRSENSDIFNLLFLSRIHPKKGLEDLFSALSNVGFNYHLSIVGDGDSNYIEELKLLSRKLMIENSISWKGALYNDDKIRSYANADVFILPSKDENFANTVLESLAQGTAVIVSKNVGLSDFVSDNNLGWVYDGSVNNLEEVLNESKTSPQKLKNIRETSTSIIESNFSEANISNRYIAMYNTSLNSH